MRAVLTRTLCLAALLLVACQQDAAPPAKKAEPAAARPAPPPPDAGPPDAAPEADAAPTDPKELAELRKKAILDARYDLAVTICAAEDMKSLDEQAVMSCVLAACRQNDVDRAQAWGKLLTGPLKAQAKKICLANKVPI